MLEEVAHELTMTLQQSSIGLENCSFIDDFSKYNVPWLCHITSCSMVMLY